MNDSSKVVLLEGIQQNHLQTERLNIAYLAAGTGEVPIVLIHGNCSSSTYFQDLMLQLTIPPADTGINAVNYRVYAPDLRGYGDTQILSVDATRGVKDFSDDLQSFVHALNLTATGFHLFGWSLGGNIAMEYAMDSPGEGLRSLTLQSPGSPFGFGGTKGLEGHPIWPDFAGSGGGTANPDFAERIRTQDRGNEQNSPRNVINTFYFKPPFRVASEREEMYVDGLLSTKVGPGNYPGDVTASTNWPNVAPGDGGVNNALSPKYLNQRGFADEVNPTLPVLWLRGEDDQIVSDTSLFDLGFLGQLGAVPGWPGAEIYPSQPMVSQVRFVLEAISKVGLKRELTSRHCG